LFIAGVEVRVCIEESHQMLLFSIDKVG
jgi:hypothetical protein